VFMAGSTALKTASTAAESAILNPVAPTPVTPTYALSGPASVDEGKSIILTLTTKNVASGETVNYIIAGTGIDESDVGSLTGTTTVGVDGKAYITVKALADVTTEGEETMTITVGGQSATVKINDISLDTSKALTLTTSLDTGAKFTGTSAADTFSGIDTGVATTTTVNTGDSLNGGAGTDRLEYSTSGAVTGSAVVATTDIEELSVFNSSTAGGYTVNASLMAGLKDVYVTGGASPLTILNGTTAPNLHLISTTQNATVAPIASAVAGTADKATILSNGSAATANVTATYNGLETIDFVAAGTATGSTTTALTLSSDALTTLNMTGNVAARVSAGLPGATATITGAVTSDAGAHDVQITGIQTTDKLSVSMGGGNDTVRISDVVALYTIAGGDGTDTLRYDGAAAVTLATSANVSGFEAVTLANAAPASFAMTGAGISKVTYTNAAAGTFGGLTTGGELNLNAGGSVTVAAAGAAANATAAQILAAATYSGTADSLTVNVGQATAATGAAASTVSAVGLERVTFNSLASSTSTEARSVAFSDDGATPTLTTITVTSSIPARTTVSATNTALSTVDLSGVSGGATFTGGRATGASITGGVGNDSLTGAAGNDVITAGDGNDTLGGAAGADSIVAGTGNDSITGGTGADTMTGGDGADRFVFAANAAGSVVSALAAPDVITDFATTVDKLEIAQTITDFLGVYANVSQAQAAAASDSRGNLAYFVSGENTLYVVAATNGVAVATDTVITLSGVTTISRADLQLGSQGQGNSITLNADPVVNTTASNAVDSTLTTNLDDTITASAATALVGANAAINGGLGVDTITATVAVASLATLNLTTAGAIGTGDTSGGVALSGVERLTANISDTNGGTLTVNNIPTSLQTLAVNGANAAVAATFTAAGQTISTNNSTNAGNGSTITFGNFAATGTGVVTQTATTGAANDTFNTIAVDGISANGGAGDDTFNLTNVAAVDNDARALILNGGTGTDTLSINLTGTFDLSDTDDVTLTSIETLALGALPASAATVVTLASGFTSITADTHTNNGGGAITATINATAAQLDALTLIRNSVSGAANGTFSVAVSNTTGPVTVDLSDTSFLDAAGASALANVDSITFNAVTAGVVTVTVDENVAVVGGQGTSDVLNITGSLGTVTVAASAFETVNLNLTQANNIVLGTGTVTVNSNVAQTGTVTMAAATTNANATVGNVTFVDSTDNLAQTFTNSGTGVMTVTLAANTAADTIVNSGTGRVVVNQAASTGVTTLTLNANGAADNINYSDGANSVGVGTTTATNRVVVTGWNWAQDTLTLDVTQTSATTAAAATPALQVVTAAGATLLASGTADVAIFNYDFGGAVEVLAGDLTGAAFLAHAGGAITAAAGNADNMYIMAYDNGNWYLYATDGLTSAGVIAADLKLIGIINGALSEVGATDIGLGG